jgi:DNA polymerase III subunit delta'
MSSPFKGVIGHERIITVLERMLENDSLPHAFLFVGANGVGRSTITEALLLALFPLIKTLSTSADINFVQRFSDEKTEKLKTQILVKQIRELTSRLALSSMNNGWKAGVIHEADRLSIGASNSLLKTLEEPKGQTILILHAQNVESVLETIASRCQIIRFYPVSKEEIVSGLLKLGFVKTDAIEAAACAYGRPGNAIRFLKDSAFRSQYETGRSAIATAYAGSIPEKLRLATDMVPKSENNKAAVLASSLDRAEEVLRSQLLHCAGVEGAGADETPSMSLTNIIHSLEKLSDVRASTRHHINPHLALEHLFL